MHTLEELKDYLVKQVPEIELMDLLEISSEDLVEAFNDRIESMYESLIEALELNEDME